MKCWVWDSDPWDACASGLGASPNSRELTVPSDALATSVAPAATAAAATSPSTKFWGGVVDNNCKENELLSHNSLSKCHCMHSCEEWVVEEIQKDSSSFEGNEARTCIRRDVR